jgi:hypothetical protein
MSSSRAKGLNIITFLRPTISSLLCTPQKLYDEQRYKIKIFDMSMSNHLMFKDSYFTPQVS